MVRAFSPQIYDIIILSMTKDYFCTFDKIAKTQKKGKDGTPSPFRLLDVGIGWRQLLANKNRVMAQNVHVTGVD